MLSSINEYKNHFISEYCAAPLDTFDGIAIRFKISDFSHCFYESSKRNKIKDKFSCMRAQRMDWIKHTLKDPTSKLFCGWDSSKKRYDHNFRVAVVNSDYVVVISVSPDRKTGYFRTAYVADNSIGKILCSPIWT
jgi:hypothetical protein